MIFTISPGENKRNLKYPNMKKIRIKKKKSKKLDTKM